MNKYMKHLNMIGLTEKSEFQHIVIVLFLLWLCLYLPIIRISTFIYQFIYSSCHPPSLLPFIPISSYKNYSSFYPPLLLSHSPIYFLLSSHSSLISSWSIHIHLSFLLPLEAYLLAKFVWFHKLSPLFKIYFSYSPSLSLTSLLMSLLYSSSWKLTYQALFLVKWT